MTAARCPYRTLEVEPGASREEVRRGYERVRAIFGPTSLAVYGLVDPREQRRALEDIEEAYRILSDPDARGAYDAAHGHPPPKGEAAAGPATSSVSAPAEGAGPAEVPASAPAQEAPVPPEHGATATTPGTSGGATTPASADAPAAAKSVGDGARASAHPAAPRGPRAPVAGTQPPRTTPPPLPPWVKVQGAPEERPPEELPPMPAIGADTVFSGELLRAVRRARGLTLKDIAARTKISLTHLESIEHERWEWLPERVFLRGFLISFARELRLDPQQVSSTFLARRGGG